MGKVLIKCIQTPMQKYFYDRSLDSVVMVNDEEYQILKTVEKTKLVPDTHSFSTDICILFRSRGKPGNRRKNHRNCTLPYFCCRTGSQTSGKWNFNSRAIIDKTSRGKGFSS